MHYLELQKIHPGMRTASEIYGADGHLIMPLNIEITETKLELLKEAGIMGAYVIQDAQDTEFVKDEENGVEKAEKLKIVKNLKAIMDEEQSDITSFFYTRSFVNFDEDVQQLVKRVKETPGMVIDRYSIRSLEDELPVHMYTTGLWCAMLAYRMNLSMGDITAATEAGLLHDIGKKFFSQGDPDMQHTRAACEFLMSREFSRKTMHGIRDHHEYLDGSGAPDGKKGERIRTTARIVAICDTFDHLVNGSKPVGRPEIALRKMKASGKFDLEMLEAFSSLVTPYFLGESVMLSDFSAGYIVKSTKQEPNNPWFIDTHGELCELKKSGLSIASYDGLKVQKLILIADDDPVILKSTKELLVQEYKVVCVTTGKAALDFVKTIKIPDLILMDYKMPKMDGAFAMELIREEKRGKDVPIVFMTGATDAETVKECLALHPAGYLVKPVKKDVLFNTVKGILKV